MCFTKRKPHQQKDSIYPLLLKCLILITYLFMPINLYDARQGISFLWAGLNFLMFKMRVKIVQ